MKVLIACLLLAASAYAANKDYVTGTMLSIVPSHSQTFYKGTSRDVYFEGYSVQIGDTIYSGWCREGLFEGCDTDFVIKDQVQVRLHGGNLYILKPNGKEQKVNITRRELAPK